eukprot:3713148-Prymnesium_polylepis.1
MARCTCTAASARACRTAMARETAWATSPTAATTWRRTTTCAPHARRARAARAPHTRRRAVSVACMCAHALLRSAHRLATCVARRRRVQIRAAALALFGVWWPRSRGARCAARRRPRACACVCAQPPAQPVAVERIGDAREWVDSLNRWCSEQVAEWVQQPEWRPHEMRVRGFQVAMQANPAAPASAGGGGGGAGSGATGATEAAETGGEPSG